MAAHPGGAAAAERRPRGRPSTAGLHQLRPPRRRAAGGRLCPVATVWVVTAKLLLSCLLPSGSRLAPEPTAAGDGESAASSRLTDSLGRLGRRGCSRSGGAALDCPIGSIEVAVSSPIQQSQSMVRDPDDSADASWMGKPRRAVSRSRSAGRVAETTSDPRAGQAGCDLIDASLAGAIDWPPVQEHSLMYALDVGDLRPAGQVLGCSHLIVSLHTLISVPLCPPPHDRRWIAIRDRDSQNRFLDSCDSPAARAHLGVSAGDEILRGCSREPFLPSSARVARSRRARCTWPPAGAGRGRHAPVAGVLALHDSPVRRTTLDPPTRGRHTS